MATDEHVLATGLYPVIAVEDPPTTAADFQAFLPVERVFETEWYVQLIGNDGRLQLGLIRFDHDSVPKKLQTPVTGIFVTVDVDDATAAWAAVGDQFEVVQPLRDEAWGQRHFILNLAGNVAVDVVEMVETKNA